MRGSRETHTRGLRVGQRVEVRSSLGSWSRGFEIAGVWHDAYLIRRLSDRRLLPIGFIADSLRVA